MENKNGFIIRNGVCIGMNEKIGTTLSQEAYDALSEEKQKDGTIYFIPDGDGEIGIVDNQVSELSTWSSQKISDEVETKLDKEYITGITDANNAIGENGVNIFVMSASSANMPLSRTGIIRSYTTIEDKYIRVNQEFSTIDNSPQTGGTYKRYGSSDDGGATYTWSNWNFVGSIDDSTTAALKTWSSSKIASQISNATAIKYTNTIQAKATYDTKFNLEQRESHIYGRLLQLDGHLGQSTATFSFLLFIKANYSNPETVYATQLAGMDGAGTNLNYSTYFELGVSSDGTLTITNKSAVTASYRFI